MTTVSALQDQLKWKNRALELILEIDRIRDSTEDERGMMAAIMSTLTDAVEAELGLLWVRDDDALDGVDELQLRTVLDRASIYDSASAGLFRDLALRAMNQPTAAVSRADVELRGRRLTQCLTTPLRAGGVTFGVLLLLNADRPFDGPEHDLVTNAISQIDSALQHAQALRELRRQKRELETIFHIDRIRDRQQDFQVMMDAVLAEICRTIAAETGFIMLYDRAGRELELRAATDHDFLATEDTARVIRATSEEAIATAKLIRREQPAGPVRAILAVPLILRDKLIGVVGVVNRQGRTAFTRTDVELLTAIASQIDTAIFESLQNQRLRGAFGQCVGPQVMERLLTIGDRDLLNGERLPITTLFSDIRGFTNMSEHLHPDLLQEVLNDHLSALTELVLKFEGTLDKYIGDCVMCFFNAPERQLDHALRAVRLAVDMQRAHHQVMERWRERLPLPPIGIGISTGEVMAGNFGSVKRLEYTVIGHDVNLAARLCGAAEADQTLISQATYELVKDFVAADELPLMHLKGIAGEVRCWNVRGLR
ncbi:MAG: GAF domain-containing protein [Anaerolineales bacterium]|nr:GAF domain-containing protein [Anaerolineales bacterium]